MGNRFWKHAILPLGTAALAVGGVHLLAAATWDRTVAYTDLFVRSRKLDPQKGDYTVAFLTDLHNAPESRLWDIVDNLNRRHLDAVLLGGDFLFAKEGAARTLDVLKYIRTRDGIWGVRGNHDRENGLFAAMEQRGMRPLCNSGTQLREDIYLAGVDDLRTGWPDTDKALAGAGKEQLTVLLSHHPDVAMNPGRKRADLVLSGHTHGGQITMFGLWTPTLTWTKHITRYGGRFRGGWARTPLSNHVYVSRGIGSHSCAPRVFARPQVVCLHLQGR